MFRQLAVTVLVLCAAGAEARPRRPAAEPRTRSDAEARCKRGELRACLVLGRWTAAGERGAAADWERAVGYFTTACEGGEPRGCTALGQYKAAHGRAAEADEFYTRACDGGDGLGCWHLARRVPPDYADHDELRERAARRAALFKRGEQLLERACSAGDLRDCVGLGDLGLRAERDGFADAVVVNARRGAVLYERACDGGYGPGCTALAGAYERGRGVKKDAARARALFRRACELGDSAACELEATGS